MALPPVELCSVTGLLLLARLLTATPCFVPYLLPLFGYRDLLARQFFFLLLCFVLMMMNDDDDDDNGNNSRGVTSRDEGDYFRWSITTPALCSTFIPSA